MATLPDLGAQPSQPVPQPSGGVATYEPPNWRQVGMAGQIVSSAARDFGEASNLIAAASDHQDQVVAMNAANANKAKQLWLEQDPSSGFLNAKGNQVIGPQFIDNYTQQAKDAQSLIADSLTNTNQRQLFQQHADIAGLQFRSALLQHQAKETQLFNQSTRDTTIHLGLSDIAAHPYDDSKYEDGTPFSTTYESQMALMGKAVEAAGQDLGLTGDALANWATAGINKLRSQALLYRTSGMLVGTPSTPGNPMAASDFFGKHEMEFDPNDRMHLAGTIRTATDAQVSRAGGQQAFKDAISTPPASAIPANMLADTVKPYDATRIGQITDQVKQSSPYDALFSKYAQAYNISPTELKMRAVVESGMNKDAVSSQGAIGLMQFTPDTAKTYGIDPKDPEQSIAAAAKLIQQAGGTVGGDMSKVDRTYYGGNANAKGPNTDQYVENLRAVRQNLLGAPAPVLTQDYLEGAEGKVIDNAKAAAQAYRPGDLGLQDQYVAEAHKSWANALAGIRGTNQQTVSSIMGLIGGDSSPKTVADLPPALQKSYSDLPGNVQAELRTRMANGDKAPTQESTNLYYSLLGQATNPATQADFADQTKTNLSAHFGDMPYSQLSSLINLQASINKKDAAQQSKDLNWSQAMSDVKQMWEPVIANKSKVAAAALTDVFTGRLSKALDNFHEQNQRWPKTTETQSIASSLLAQGAAKDTGWINDDKVMAFQTDPSKFYVPLPSARSPEYAALATSFQKVMGRAPGNGELQQWYTKYKLGGGK